MLEGRDEDGFLEVPKDEDRQRKAVLPKAVLPIAREEKRDEKLFARKELTKALEPPKPKPTISQASDYSYEELQAFLRPPGPKAIVTMDGYEFLEECDFRNYTAAHEWKNARSPASTCIDFWDLSQVMHRHKLNDAIRGDYFIAPNKDSLNKHGRRVMSRGYGVFTKQGNGRHCDWPRHDYNPNVVPLHDENTIDITTIETYKPI